MNPVTNTVPPQQLTTTATTTSILDEEAQLSTLLQEFILFLEELLVSLLQVFPECSGTRQKYAQFSVLIKPATSATFNETLAEKLIKKWHQDLSPFYTLCDQGRLDLVILQSTLPLVQELNLLAKWQDPEFNEESKVYLLEYIQKLNSRARDYNSLHFMQKGLTPRLKNLLFNVAQREINTQNQTQGTSPNLANIDYLAIAEEISTNLNEEDMKSLLDNIGNFRDMYNSMPESVKSQVSNVVPFPKSF